MLSLSSNCAAIEQIWRTTFQPYGPTERFAESMKMVQTVNDRKFVLLGSETSMTQKNVNAFGDVVKNHLTATSEVIDQLFHSLNYFAHCAVHTKHFSNLVFKVENRTLYLDVVYTHLRFYQSAFVFCRSNLYSAVFSISSSYVAFVLSTPNCLAEIVPELSKEYFQRDTKLSPVMQVGYETTYYAVQTVLEVPILASDISVVLGKPMSS